MAKRIDELEEIMNHYESTNKVKGGTPQAKPSAKREATSKDEDDAPDGVWQRVTFICFPSDIWRMRAIALKDRKPIKIVLHEALAAYIEAWQMAHKEVNIDIFK